MASNSRNAITKPLNRSLHAAKAAKQDEFYTQYVDIQKEVEAYLEYDKDTFRGKIVYWSPAATDDPFESNFFKYFAANFNKLGLKRLITTSYDGSPIAGQLSLFPEYSEGNGHRQKPKAVRVILDHVKDEDGDGATGIEDVKLFLKRNKAARRALKADDLGGATPAATSAAPSASNCSNKPTSLSPTRGNKNVEYPCQRSSPTEPDSHLSRKRTCSICSIAGTTVGSRFRGADYQFAHPSGHGNGFAISAGWIC